MHTKSVCVVVAFVISWFGSAPILADDAADALSSCRKALAGVGTRAQYMTFERRQERWRPVYMTLIEFTGDFEIGQLAAFASLEGIGLNAEFSARAGRAFDGVNKLAALQNLRRLGIKPREFREEVSKALAMLPRLDELDLSNYGTNRVDRETALEGLRELPNLRRLDLTGIRLTDDLMQHLTPLKDLEELNLEGNHGLTDVGLAELKHLRKLRVLKLPSGGRLTERSLAELEDLRELRDLAVGGMTIGPTALAALEALPHLESLRSVHATGLQEADFSGLRSLKFLAIGIGGEKKVRLPEGVRQLSLSHMNLPNFDFRSCPHLEAVHVNCELQTWAPGASLKDLAVLPELKRLKLVQASDSDVKEIAGLDSLRELDLQLGPQTRREPRYGDEGVKSLAGLQQLQSFKSDSSLLTDDGMAVLRNFKDLRRLELKIGRRVTDRGMENVWGLKRLQFLRVTLPPSFQGSLGDIFAKVGEMSELEELDVPGEVTDEGLMHLAGLKKLQRLVLGQNDGYTDKALASLMLALPNLQTVSRSYRRGGE